MSPSAPTRQRPLAAIRLIDRRTGRPHRINGMPLVLYSRDTALAAETLLQGRDPRHWDIRIDLLPGRVAP